MTQNELNKILDLHKKWLNDEDGGKRANLRDADLRGADLYDADLRGADLCGADLCGADLDYSCWPLWCGSLDVKIDDRISRQLLYHIMRAVKCSPKVSDDFKAALFTPELIVQANMFHRVGECGEINLDGAV
jgi:hypothetical protein